MEVLDRLDPELEFHPRRERLPGGLPEDVPNLGSESDNRVGSVSDHEGEWSFGEKEAE